MAPILRFFEFEHLPAHLQDVSAPVGELARAMDELLPDGAEKSAGLRKLLEAKDCFVRAALPDDRDRAIQLADGTAGIAFRDPRP